MADSPSGGAPGSRRGSTRPPLELSDVVRLHLVRRLRTVTGVDFAGYRPGMLERAVGSRMAWWHLDLVADYAVHLEGDAEVRYLATGVLVSASSFFRDRGVFAALDAVVLPRVLAVQVPTTAVRIWIAGCADGREAYSVAISLHASLKHPRSPPPIQIFATDADPLSLAHARRGHYTASACLDLPPQYLARFLSPIAGGYVVRQSLRKWISFRQHVLGQAEGYRDLDLVTCRNVLLYMREGLQQRVLTMFHRGLKPGGFLVLGSGEALRQAETLFAPVDGRLRIFSRRP